MPRGGKRAGAGRKTKGWPGNSLALTERVQLRLTKVQMARLLRVAEARKVNKCQVLQDFTDSL